MKRLPVPMLCLVLLLPGQLASQTPCEPSRWLPGDGFPGVTTSWSDPATQYTRVTSMVLYDPDGPGPNDVYVAVGGYFWTAGKAVSPGVALWSPSTGEWESPGGGIKNVVEALAVDASGALVAGGQFTEASGVAAKYIARWNGSTWSPIGIGLENYPSALLTLPSGEIIAGGSSLVPGTGITAAVAMWTGTEWIPVGDLGADPAYGVVRALAVLPNGDLVAGGRFPMPGGQSDINVAFWDGQSWQPMGAGLTGLYSAVETLAVTAAGELFAGGSFKTSGGTSLSNVARWDGTSWAPVGGGVFGTVRALSGLRHGGLIATGNIVVVAGGVQTKGIARWDGAQWMDVGGGFGNKTNDPNAEAVLELPDGRIVAGGWFNRAGDAGVLNMAVWDEKEWRPVSDGFQDRVLAAKYLSEDEIVVGGRFTWAGATRANRVARWDGHEWQPMGAGLDGDVLALQVMPNGDVVAGGNFITSKSMTVNRVARWNGAEWQPLGTGVNEAVRCLALSAGGDLFVGGDFYYAGGIPQTGGIARWDGSSWHGMEYGTNGQVYSIAVLPNGHVVAGGNFTKAGIIFANNIALWNGGTWKPLGSGLNATATRVAALPNGDIVAAGLFSSAGGVSVPQVARWDGSQWWPFGVGPGAPIKYPGLNLLRPLANGDLLAHGCFSLLGNDCHPLAVWNGIEWSPIGEPVHVAFGWDIDLSPGGEILLAGGSFQENNIISWGVARLSCDICPADCDGSGGLSVDDFYCFQALFAQGDPKADCDFDGQLDLFDFLCFVNAFNAGCP